ncbi:MAG: adenylosuccinate synthetase [Patescibacteria group bacterium]
MITLVVGGQYGGEGKGKVAAFLAKRDRPTIVARTGGVNSKHTVVEGGNSFDLRQIPSACAVGHTWKVVYGAGSLIHIPTLFKEMEMLGVSRSQILIDEKTGILGEDQVRDQRADKRYEQIGSTLTGTGYATAQRALRKLPLAKDFPELAEMIGDVPSFIFKNLKEKESVLVEGHQGAGLSNFHGDYPYTSNRDSTAAALLSELGVGPLTEMKIVLVLKVFPTRNHNGHLPNEMSAEEALQLGIEEYGGGSWGIDNKRRRVGQLDMKEVLRAVYLNTPSEIALTGMDYLDPASKNSSSESTLSEQARNLIAEIEGATGVRVTLISTGPETDSMISRISLTA